MPTVVHVVSFKYKSEVDETERKALFDEFTSFKTRCVDQSGNPYLVDFKASATNTSVEKAGKGFHHIFVSTFPSQDHVKYYLEKDPVHRAFVERVKPALEDLFIYDFEV